MNELVAVDLVLLFDQESEQKLIQLSNTLENSSYVLSNERKPHLSLCKFLIKKEDIDNLKISSKNFILSVDLLSEHLENEGRTTCLFMKENLELLHFQNSVVSDLSPFFQNREMLGSFFTEEVNKLTKSWVSSAFSNPGKNFDFHISLGFGKMKKQIFPSELRTSRVALVQMGNYCSCSKILRHF